MSWSPANDLEVALHHALETGDEETFLDELLAARLLLPAGASGTSWPVVLDENLFCIPVFTSPAAMAVGLADQVSRCRLVEFGELAASWPDNRCALLLNPLTPLHSRIAPSDLFRLAAGPEPTTLHHDAPPWGQRWHNSVT